MKRSLLFTIGCAACVASCNAVFGFDEAKVDPKLTETTTETTLPLSCEVYCEKIMKNCTGLNQEYISTEICLAMCPHFDLGIPDKHDEDSLACRLYHAASAAESPTVHCKHAGATGAGHCGGAPCNAYCLLVNALCTDELSPFEGGELGCRQECAQYTYITYASVPDITPSGNTLNCRVYHLQSAYAPDNPVAKTTHCPHTGTNSVTCTD